MEIIEINRRGVRKEEILLTNKEIMGITVDPVISMTRRNGIIMLLPVTKTTSGGIFRVPNKS